MPKLITGRKFRNVAVRTSTSGTAPSVPTSRTNEKGIGATGTGSKASRDDKTTTSAPVASTNSTAEHMSIATSSMQSVVPDPIPKVKHIEPPITTNSVAGLSKGQKKRLIKREQYMKKERMILSTLKLRKQEEQSKRIDGLDALKEALLDAVTTDNAAATPSSASKRKNAVDTNANSTSHLNSLKSNSSRQQLLQREMMHMELVLQHPTFQEDPLATIREHLQNTFQSSNGTSSNSSTMTHKKINTSGATTTKSDVMTTIRKRKKNHKFRATRTKRK